MKKLTAKQPNILFIVLDTQRLDRLSVYGHAQRTSRFLDYFAARSTVFDRAFSAAQWTIPSHAAMFTGRPVSEHGVVETLARLPQRFLTLAQILAQGGYRTTGFSNNGLIGVIDNDVQRGFQDFYVYAGIANRPVDVTRGVFQRRLQQRLVQTFRRSVNRVVSNAWFQQMATRVGMIVPNWTQLINQKGNVVQTIDDVIAHLRQHGRGPQPLFTFINLMGAHLPYHPPRKFVRRIAPGLWRDRAARAIMQRLNDDPVAWMLPRETPLSAFEQHVIDSYYNAEVAHQDVHLGRLFRFLKHSRQQEHTMVIVCADHGEALGDHNLFGHGFTVAQEIVHVPLIIRYPAMFKPGTRVTQNVSTRRLFHTVLAASGVPVPIGADDAAGDVVGLSLETAVQPDRDPEGGVVISEAFPPATMVQALKTHIPEHTARQRFDVVRRAVFVGDLKLSVVGDNVEAVETMAAGNRVSAANLNPAETFMLQQHLNRFLEAMAQRGAVTETLETVSPEVLANLRALGYME